MKLISRRTALAGMATVTAATTAAGVAIAALPAGAEAEDPILSLCKEWREACARSADLTTKASAAEKLIPATVREALDQARRKLERIPQHVLDAYRQHYELSGTKALDDANEAVSTRICDLEVQIIQAPATTLRGLLAKARIAWHISAEDQEYEKTGPDPDAQSGRLEDDRMIWSLLQDLERLTARAGS